MTDEGIQSSSGSITGRVYNLLFPPGNFTSRYFCLSNTYEQIYLGKLSYSDGMAIMVRSRPAGPWNGYRFLSPEHVFSGFQNVHMYYE